MNILQAVTMKTILMSKRSCKILLLWCTIFLCNANPCSAQASESRHDPLNLPADYFKLGTDTARMRFLMTTISDSLDEGRLDHVMPWSRLGLTIAEKNSNDTMKGIFYFDIGKAYAYKYNKFDSAVFYYKKVIPFFPDKHRNYNLLSVREIMDRYGDLGNKDSSFVYLNMLRSLIDTMPDSFARKAGLAQNIAVVYQGFGMYRSAINYFQIAIQGNRLNKRSRGLGLALANLGELYNGTGDIKKAIQYAKEGLHYLADVNMPFMQTAGNITEYYITLKQYDSALAYLKISDSVVNKINDFESGILNKNRLADIYTAQKKFAAAKQLLDKNLQLLRGSESGWDLCKTLLSYVGLDTAIQDFPAAKDHLEQIITISRQNEFKAFTVEALLHLSVVYSKLGDYKNAFAYQNQYVNLRESIADEKTRSDLADLEINYKMQQKEQEILLLKKDNDIKNLQLANNKRTTQFYVAALAFAIVIFIVLYYQRSQRNKIETKKLKAELENEVLRLQMNPHFIFNSLNSIENFIMQNEKRLASDYLNKFARLIRMILDSSRNELVPVAKDMDALQLYIDLEQLRFNNKFSCKTFIDPALLNGDYSVPSLLVQPYVENAIVHGLAHSEEANLHLSVTATLEGSNVKYTITDNGIGRKQAAVYNSQNKPHHKSVGLIITEERINNFNKSAGISNAVKITDLYADDQTPAGTKVEIILNAV